MSIRAVSSADSLSYDDRYSEPSYYANKPNESSEFGDILAALRGAADNELVTSSMSAAQSMPDSVSADGNRAESRQLSRTEPCEKVILQQTLAAAQENYCKVHTAERSTTSGVLFTASI